MPFPTLTTTNTPPALFPTYLVPSLPFRRRKSSSTSTTSTNSTTSTSPSTTSDPDSSEEPYLSPPTPHLRCTRCHTDLAHTSQIISKGFTGRHGRAYLISPAPHSPAAPTLPNTYTHKPVPRTLVTGPHTVADLSCAHCGAVLGWKYVSAQDAGQRYKVGKYILEAGRVCRVGGWDFQGEGEWEGKGEGREEDVEFDSQDEEECEALFAGRWEAEWAREWRGRRDGRKRGVGRKGE